ncbi:roadblock/LC7 domain-containing protein [Streptomyces monticola]|uniref:Roadblock/LC7 domain-containing protein n=1 Tax=Streptomyces monticola TaxID=2666263 RepID=A0ABW2JEZ3_9ACTN
MLSVPHRSASPSTSAARPVETATRLVTDFCARTPGAAFAVLHSTEGLVLSASDGVRTDDAERLAALAAGLGALTRSAAEAYGGGWVNATTVDMGRHHLCLIPVDARASLVFLANERGEPAHVMYEAARTAHELARLLDGPGQGDLCRLFLGTY